MNFEMNIEDIDFRDGICRNIFRDKIFDCSKIEECYRCNFKDECASLADLAYTYKL